MSKIKLTYSDPIADEYRWFAWYPVSTADKGIRWLQFVYKRKYRLRQEVYPDADAFFMYSVEQGVLL